MDDNLINEDEKYPMAKELWKVSKVAYGSTSATSCELSDEQQVLAILRSLLELQRHSPTVGRLQYHLPNQQFVAFREEDHLYKIVNRECIHDTMLTKWFEVNKKYMEARSLLDKYYLRMLLYKVRGAQSFEDLRTFNGIIYPTFKQVYATRGLSDEDNEWHEALSEASTLASSVNLRNMFSTMLIFSEIIDPVNLWERHWRAMLDDLQHRVRRDLTNNNIHLTDEELKDWILQEIECILNRNGKSLADFPPMPQPSSRSFAHITNRLIREEIQYDSIVEE
ncbi:UNVERIFIED_CONTAM: hypothetical protein Slati_2772200 [Sesamum latifolium]|uniref:Uncharacterized protein n=1 Tax=Sesamum latifolium TaxID=2727402 RepID=A0AAW2VXE8_9LAMI